MAQQELEIMSSAGNSLQKVYLEPLRNAGESQSVIINNNHLTLNVFMPPPILKKKKVVIKRIRFKTTERAFNENGRLFTAALILSATAGLLIASM
jgi:hypothetical protein